MGKSDYFVNAAEMFLGDAIELARRGEYEQADALVEMHAWCMLMARPTQTNVPPGVTQMICFNATIDFDDTDALELELRRVMPNRQPGTPFTVVVPANEGQGAIYQGDDTIPELNPEDWCVTAHTYLGAALALKELLHA